VGFLEKPGWVSLGHFFTTTLVLTDTGFLVMMHLVKHALSNELRSNILCFQTWHFKSIIWNCSRK